MKPAMKTLRGKPVGVEKLLFEEGDIGMEAKSGGHSVSMEMPSRSPMYYGFLEPAERVRPE